MTEFHRRLNEIDQAACIIAGIVHNNGIKETLLPVEIEEINKQALAIITDTLVLLRKEYICPPGHLLFYNGMLETMKGK